MSTVETIDYEQVLARVRSWAPSQRLIFVQDVLRTLDPIDARPTTPSQTLSKAQGLLATAQPAPSDNDIARWLDEDVFSGTIHENVAGHKHSP